MKNNKIDFDKIVQKMRKKWQKLWTVSDLEAVFSQWNTLTKNTLYKYIHRLLVGEVIVSIRKWLYLSKMNPPLDPEDFYWQIVKKILAENYLGQGIITGEKALAFDLKDYSLPEVLPVAVSRNPGKVTILWNYLLIAQVIRSDTRKTLYGLVKKYAIRVDMDDSSLLVTSPEHAILESLTVRFWNDITDTSVLERWLKKNHTRLREEVFADFIPHRYISGLNRLKYIASDLHIDSLYKMCVRLIDTVGKWCHLSRSFLARNKK